MVPAVDARHFACDTHSERGLDFAVEACRHTVGIAGAVGNARFHALETQWRNSVDVHQPGHGVAPVEDVLRAAEDFHAVDVGEVEVVVVLVDDGDIVDVQPHGGLVDACAQPSDVDRRGHARAIGRHVEVRSESRGLAHVHEIVVGDRAATDICHRLVGIGMIASFDSCHRYFAQCHTGGCRYRVDAVTRGGGGHPGMET